MARVQRGQAKGPDIPDGKRKEGNLKRKKKGRPVGALGYLVASL